MYFFFNYFSNVWRGSFECLQVEPSRARTFCRPCSQWPVRTLALRLAVTIFWIIFCLLGCSFAYIIHNLQTKKKRTFHKTKRSLYMYSMTYAGVAIYFCLAGSLYLPLVGQQLISPVFHSSHRPCFKCVSYSSRSFDTYIFVFQVTVES